jgi:hypothetical protein
VRAALAICCLALSLVSCVHPPPTLGPVANADYKKTQVIKVLDLIRDAAVDANAQTPPLISTATTRKVVLAHQTALKTIQASDAGWPAAVGAAFGQLGHDPSILPAEAQKLAPYFTLIATVLQQVQTS